MANIIQNMVGLGELTEQIIASDLLMSSKSAIKSYAAALTESTSPEVTKALKRQLDDAINAKEKISTYMMNMGYYNAYDPKEQFAKDAEASDNVMKL